MRLHAAMRRAPHPRRAASVRGDWRGPGSRHLLAVPRGGPRVETWLPGVPPKSRQPPPQRPSARTEPAGANRWGRATLSSPTGPGIQVTPRLFPQRRAGRFASAHGPRAQTDRPQCGGGGSLRFGTPWTPPRTPAGRRRRRRRGVSGAARPNRTPVNGDAWAEGEISRNFCILN